MERQDSCRENHDQPGEEAKLKIEIFRITQDTIPVKFKLTAACEDDTGVVKGMQNNINGLIIADRGYYEDVYLSIFTREGNLSA